MQDGKPPDGKIAELVGAVRSLAAARSVDDVAEIVRGTARRLAGADGSSFVLRRGDDCHYVDEEAISPLWKGRRFPMTSCISGWAMLHQSPVAISDIYADDRIPHEAYRPTFVRSLVMVPIGTVEPIGAIGTYWASKHEATPEDIAVLQALADSTAVAMDNVSLYADLEARVAERTARLAAVNDELRRFASVLAHDVRQPLTTITGYAELLNQRYTEDLPDEAKAMLGVLRRAARNLANFVTDLQSYATASTLPAIYESVPLEDLVGSVLARLDHDLESRHAVIGFQGPSEVVADRALLTQALQNLVSNAVNYTPADRIPDIKIAVAERTDAWELSVSDNGPGVDPADRERIFEPFVRSRASKGRPGTGLGLAVCKRVAEHHGGRIRVERAPSGGATFILTLPRRQPDTEPVAL